MAVIRVKPLSLQMVQQVLEKFLDGGIDRRELSAWSRAYVELMNDYGVDFVPPDKTDLIMETIKEAQAADLVINDQPVFTETRVRVLLRRIGKHTWAN